MVIEIEARSVPFSPDEKSEQTKVIKLMLLTTPAKEASIRFSDSTTFEEVLADARVAFRLDQSLHFSAVDSKNVMYSGRINVLAALKRNRNTHVYITVDMLIDFFLYSLSFLFIFINLFSLFCFVLFWFVCLFLFCFDLFCLSFFIIYLFIFFIFLLSFMSLLSEHHP